MRPISTRILPSLSAALFLDLQGALQVLGLDLLAIHQDFAQAHGARAGRGHRRGGGLVLEIGGKRGGHLLLFYLDGSGSGAPAVALHHDLTGQAPRVFQFRYSRRTATTTC